MPETDDGTQADAKVKQPPSPSVGTIWGLSYIKRKFHERRAKYEAQTPEEKAAWRTANATLAIAVFTVVLALVGGLTLYEVIAGGTDTHDLAVAAKEQADRTKEIAQSSKDLAINAANQVTQLKGMVDANAKQAKALSGQLGVMQKQFEVTDRAWISVTVSIGGPLMYDARNGVHAGFKFILSNTGRSPAQGVHISPELVMTILLSNTEAEQKRICEGHAKAIAKGAHGYQEYIVFPGEPDVEEEDVQLSIEEIDAFYSTFEKGLGRPDPLPIGLVGCVDYTFPSSPAHHQTGFAFQLLTREGGSPLISQTPIAADRMTLLKTPLGRYFVN